MRLATVPSATASLAASLMLLVAALPGSGQEDVPRVGPGDFVRVTTPETRTEGTLEALEERAILLAPFSFRDDEPVRVALSDITLVEVQEGGGGGWWKGALIGAAAVGVLAGVAGAAGGCGDYDGSACAGTAFAAGAILGGAIGAGVGALATAPSWVPAELAGRGGGR